MEAAMTDVHRLTCPSCRSTFVNIFPAGECRECGNLVCGHCIHHDHPDYEGTICQDCITRRSPMGRLGELEKDTLLSILSDPDSPDAPLVARLAGDRKDKFFLSPLCTALKSQRIDVRREAAVALGKIGESAAVGPLIERLKDDAPAVRGRAAGACGLIGDQSAIEPLKALLEDPSRQVAGNAVTALLRLVGKNGAPLLEDVARGHAFSIVRCEALTGLSLLDRDAGLTTAVYCLESEAKDVVICACRILADLNDVRAMPGLQKLLASNPKASVRMNAQAALEKIAKPDA